MDEFRIVVLVIIISILIMIKSKYRICITRWIKLCDGLCTYFIVIKIITQAQSFLAQCRLGIHSNTDTDFLAEISDTAVKGKLFDL